MKNNILLRVRCNRCVGKPDRHFSPKDLNGHQPTAVDLIEHTETFRRFKQSLKCNQCGQKDAVVVKVLDGNARTEAHAKKQRGQSLRGDEHRRGSSKPNKSKQGNRFKNYGRIAGKSPLPPPTGDDVERFKQATKGSAARTSLDEFGNVEAPEFGTRDDYKKDRKSWVSRRD